MWVIISVYTDTARLDRDARNTLSCIVKAVDFLSHTLRHLANGQIAFITRTYGVKTDDVTQNDASIRFSRIKYTPRSF